METTSSPFDGDYKYSASSIGLTIFFKVFLEGSFLGKVIFKVKKNIELIKRTLFLTSTGKII